MKRKLVWVMGPLFLLMVLISTFITVSAEQKDLISSAKKYIGTPYVYGGTTPSGFDCSGYIGYVYKQHGVELPRTTKQLYRTGTPISGSDLQSGDLVFFNTFGSGVSHAGIFIGEGKFIHASYSRGITIDSLYSGYWKPRFLGAKRVLKNKPEIIQVSYQIDELTKEKLIKSEGNLIIDSDQSLTRAEVAALIVKIKGMATDETNSRFSDLKSNKWYFDDIIAAEQFGMFDYINGNQLNPEEKVSRGEFAIMIAGAFNLNSTEVKNFKDIEQNHRAYEEILALKEKGIINGYKDGTFRPNQTVKPNEMSIVLYRLLR